MTQKAKTYTEAKSWRRLEAGLRGARTVGHMPKTSITPKLAKAQPKRVLKKQKPRKGGA